MLALNQDARRFIIRTSGRLERRLKDLAREVASQQDVSEVSQEHIEVAVKNFFGDDTRVLHFLLESEGVCNAERRAG